MEQRKSFRRRVLDALTDELRKIGPETGYEVDMSTSVFRGRKWYDHKDPLPLISVIDHPVPIAQIPSPRASTDSFGEWELIVQGFVVDDPDHPTDPAHDLLAQTRAALMNLRPRGRGHDILGMKGRVDDIQVGAGVVSPEDDYSSKAYFLLPVTLRIAEDAGDPFS